MHICTIISKYNKKVNFKVFLVRLVLNYIFLKFIVDLLLEGIDCMLSNFIVCLIQ